MHDPARVREREPFEHLGGRLDCAVVTKLAPVRRACRSVDPGTYSYGM